MRASFLEVYQESVYDLLAARVSAERDPASARPLAEAAGRVFAAGAVEEKVLRSEVNNSQ